MSKKQGKIKKVKKAVKPSKAKSARPAGGKTGGELLICLCRLTAVPTFPQKRRFLKFPPVFRRRFRGSRGPYYCHSEACLAADRESSLEICKYLMSGKADKPAYALLAYGS